MERTFNAGDEAITLPPLVLYNLKKAWPLIVQLGKPMDHLDRMETMVHVAAHAQGLKANPEASDDEYDAEVARIKSRIIRRIHSNQYIELDRAISDLIRASGLLPEKSSSGEAGATSLTATGTV